MAEFPWFRMFPAAMVADTQHLSNEEFGAYHRMIYAAWMSRDCVLPDDDQKLARIAHMTPQKWRYSGATLRAFWSSNGNGWLAQKKLGSERNFARASSEKASKAAKAKWLKERATADAPAQRELLPSISPDDAILESQKLDVRKESVSVRGGTSPAHDARGSNGSAQSDHPKTHTHDGKKSPGEPHGKQPTRRNAFADEI